MKIQKTTKLIWEELMAFLAWAAPTIWSMFANIDSKQNNVCVTGVIQSEDGHFITTYSDGTTESGTPGVKGPLV